MSTHQIQFAITSDSVPEAAGLFLELEELYKEIESLRDSISDQFNQSPARDMMGGFIIPGKTDLVVEWKDSKATVHLRSKKG